MPRRPTLSPPSPKRGISDPVESSPRRGRPDRAPPDGSTRDRILKAAERLFAEHGFSGVSMPMIAKASSITAGAIYKHFDGKDDLFRQMFVRRGAEFMLGMHAVLESEGTATEKLHMLIDFQIGFFRRLRPFGRLLVRYGNASLLSDPNELDAVIANNVAESMGLQSALFAAGQTTGEFCAGDATVLAHLFSGLMAAYQSVDPLIMSDGTDTRERLSLPELHQLVARAFSV